MSRMPQAAERRVKCKTTPLVGSTQTKEEKGPSRANAEEDAKKVHLRIRPFLPMRAVQQKVYQTQLVHEAHDGHSQD